METNLAMVCASLITAMRATSPREDMAAELGVSLETYQELGEKTGADIPISAIHHMANIFGVESNADHLAPPRSASIPTMGQKRARKCGRPTVIPAITQTWHAP